MAQGGKWVKRLTSAADLPDEAVPGQPLVEVFSSFRVLVENHMGVTEYGDSVIQVKVKFGSICVCGTNLELALMTKGQLIITGCIESIQLNRRAK